METPIKTTSLSERMEKYIFENGISSDELFKVLNVCINYGNILDIKSFAKSKNTTVQNIYQNYKTYNLIGKKVVIISNE